jgi:hypothetical protein
MAEVETGTVQDLELEACAVLAQGEEVAFVLSYDFELTCLIQEGVLRAGMVPSGFKGG